MKKAKDKHKEEEDKFIEEYLAQREEERELLETELQELKERQVYNTWIVAIGAMSLLLLLLLLQFLLPFLLILSSLSGASYRRANGGRTSYAGDAGAG